MTGDLKREAARAALAAQDEADDGWDTLMAFASLDAVEARAAAQPPGAQVIDLAAWRECARAAAALRPYWRKVAMAALVKAREEEQHQLVADRRRIAEEIEHRAATLWCNDGAPAEEARARAEADVLGRRALRAAKVLVALGPLFRAECIRIRYRDDLPPEDCPPPGASTSPPPQATESAPVQMGRKLPPFDWSTVVPLPPPTKPLPPGWKMPHPLDPVPVPTEAP